MQLSNYAKNVILVALDHMEEHLETIELDGCITEDTYNLRMEAVSTARTKIQNN
jgi:hypothetical protein